MPAFITRVLTGEARPSEAAIAMVKAYGSTASVWAGARAMGAMSTGVAVFETTRVRAEVNGAARYDGMTGLPAAVGGSRIRPEQGKGGAGLPAASPPSPLAA